MANQSAFLMHTMRLPIPQRTNYFPVPDFVNDKLVQVLARQHRVTRVKLKSTKIYFDNCHKIVRSHGARSSRDVYVPAKNRQTRVSDTLAPSPVAVPS